MACTHLASHSCDYCADDSELELWNIFYRDASKLDQPSSEEGKRNMRSQTGLVSVFIVLMASLSLTSSMVPAQPRVSDLTITETLTQISASTMTTVGFTQAMTISLQVTPSSQGGDITPPSFTIPGTTAQYCGTYAFFEFSATASQQVTGQLGSSQLINFYLMTDAELQDWLNTNRCPVTNTLVRQETTQSFNLDWTAPQAGKYAFLFLDEESATANVSFSPQTSYPVETQYTIYSLATRTITTSHAIHTPNEQLPILVLMCVTLGIFGLEVWRIRRSKPHKRRRDIAIPQTTCSHCRFHNPATNGYCGNCGSRLEDTTHVYE